MKIDLEIYRTTWCQINSKNSNLSDLKQNVEIYYKLDQEHLHPFYH